MLGIFSLGYTLALLTSGNVLCNYYVAVEHHLFICGVFFIIVHDKLLTRRKPSFLLESQSKELAEMLAQEDLVEMGLTSPSEIVAYLLVERATLLERLEATERRLESQSLSVNLKEVDHQVKS